MKHIELLLSLKIACVDRASQLVGIVIRLKVIQFFLQLVARSRRHYFFWQICRDDNETLHFLKQRPRSKIRELQDAVTTDLLDK